MHSSESFLLLIGCLYNKVLNYFFLCVGEKTGIYLLLSIYVPIYSVYRVITNGFWKTDTSAIIEQRPRSSPNEP